MSDLVASVASQTDSSQSIADAIANPAVSNSKAGFAGSVNSTSGLSLQSQKLQQLQDSGVPSSIYLQNGIRIIGRVVAFDATGITIEPPDGAGLEELVITRALVSSVAKSRAGEEPRRQRNASPGASSGRDRDREREPQNSARS